MCWPRKTLRDVSPAHAARDPTLWRRLTLTYRRIKEITSACRDHVIRCSELKDGNIIPGDIGIPWWTFAASENEESRSDMIMSEATQAKKTLKSFLILPSLPPLNPILSTTGKEFVFLFPPFPHLFWQNLQNSWNLGHKTTPWRKETRELQSIL